MRKKLTTRYLDSLANSRDTRTDRETIHDTISDAAVRVGPQSVSWYTFYRVKGTTKLRSVKLGTYPALSLDAARTKAAEIRGHAEAGRDPAAEVRERKRFSFAAVVDEYLELNAGRDPDGLANTKRNLGHAVALFGDLMIDQITPAHVDLLVSKRSRDGAYAANATFGDVRALFNWLIGRGRLKAAESPMIGLKKPHSTKARDVYLEPEELAAVWRVAVAEPYPFGPWLRMIIATGGQRRQDVSAMRWRDIGPLKLKERVPGTEKLRDVTFEHTWRDSDPSKAQDGQRVHYVPLNALAQGILRDVPRFLHGEYVFSGTAGTRPLSGFSRAMRRMNKLADLDKQWSAHTIRHTVATLSTEYLGVLSDEVAMVQNRVSEFLRGAEKVYTHSTFIERKRRVLDTWGEFVSALVSDEESAVNG